LLLLKIYLRNSFRLFYSSNSQKLSLLQYSLLFIPIFSIYGHWSTIGPIGQLFYGHTGKAAPFNAQRQQPIQNGGDLQDELTGGGRRLWN
jgi:hypothetical protein